MFSHFCYNCEAQGFQVIYEPELSAFRCTSQVFPEYFEALQCTHDHDPKRAFSTSFSTDPNWFSPSNNSRAWQLLTKLCSFDNMSLLILFHFLYYLSSIITKHSTLNITCFLCSLGTFSTASINCGVTDIENDETVQIHINVQLWNVPEGRDNTISDLLEVLWVQNSHMNQILFIQIAFVSIVMALCVRSGPTVKSPNLGKDIAEPNCFQLQPLGGGPSKPNESSFQC